jgi:hypothetical protein
MQTENSKYELIHLSDIKQPVGILIRPHLWATTATLKYEELLWTIISQFA